MLPSLGVQELPKDLHDKLETVGVATLKVGWGRALGALGGCASGPRGAWHPTMQRACTCHKSTQKLAALTS